MYRSPSRNLSREPGEVALRRRCCESSGIIVVMIETASSPCGTWKKAYAYRYADTSPVVPLFARTSTNSNAIWFVTT